MKEEELEAASKFGRPMPFKMGRVEGESSLFEPIINEIREYLESMAKAEMGDE
jgi:hypothetical protein